MDIFFTRMHNVTTLMLGQNGRHFPDDIFSNAFSWMKKLWISVIISLKFVPKGPINNIPALVQIMAWRQAGDKPLPEPEPSLLTHVCLNGLCTTAGLLYLYNQICNVHILQDTSGVLYTVIKNELFEAYSIFLLYFLDYNMFWIELHC